MTGCLGGTDGKGQQDLVLRLWRGSGLEPPQGKGIWLGAQGHEKAERGTGDEEPNREGSSLNTKEKGNTEMLFNKCLLPTLCSE